MNVFTARDGAQLAYYDDCFAPPWETAQPVLLLHPAMGNSQRWFHWMPALTARYRVIRLDLRGHGASQIPRDTDEFSLQHLVGDAVELLDRLKIENLHVVGNSAGGYVSQQLAIQHPERVRTLSLYGSTPGLKNSHAPTWLPKIKDIGLRKFLADTIS
ncbi:MAG TPA: alpha/beta fold hydrolase, partial [Bordetella sp.]|nr:alpha/beta fold hydrolase [Bordetella sp.]